jgi:predicted heme/steroid binding protein/uncharacterized membrane protein
MKTMTREELAQFNGKEGKPAYVAYRGKVYDVTASKRWRDGKHMMKHEAGNDLTASLSAAPHDEKVFANFQVVAELDAGAPAEEAIKAPWPLSLIYARWPFFKRHAHPFAVHFPIGLILAGFLFAVLHLLFAGDNCNHLERTSFHLSALAACCAPFAVLTGMQSWWLFYGLGKTFKLMFKLVGAIVVCVLTAILALMHFANPQIIIGPLSAMSYVFLGLYLADVLLVGAVGFFGGQLTFPE